MRFSKSDILNAFDRKDQGYRLATLASTWLRAGKHFSPTASEMARGTWMESNGRWIAFSDLADLIDDDMTREGLVSDFMLDHLHALIRHPFEILNDYCEDFEAVKPEAALLSQLKACPWYPLTRLMRNAISHNFIFEFNRQDLSRLPISWGVMNLTADLNGQRMNYELWHKPGYALFVEMRAFAEAMPKL